MPYRMPLYLRKVCIHDPSLKGSGKLYAKDSLRRLICEVHIAVKLCNILLVILFVQIMKLVVRCTQAVAHGSACL